METDVLTTCVEVIFRVKDKAGISFLINVDGNYVTVVGNVLICLQYSRLISFVGGENPWRRK